MYIRKVFARAFGGLRNHELDLAPGLTIVHGQNESAKSTWHAAITVGLCGRRRGAGRTSADADFEARHRPWDLDESWAVGIELLLDDGREIEIERDLHRQANSVRDVQLGGRAVPDELMRDGSPDAAVWLGLDRTSFASTASVRQADILSVTDEPGSLTEFLGRAAATAGGTESAASAMKRVARFRKDQVGTDRANAVKPLRTAINRVVEAEQRLSEAQRAHSDYLQAAASAEQYRTHLVQLEKRSRSLQFAAEAFDLESAAKRFATLQRLAAQCPDGEPATPTTADLAPLLSARAQLHAVRAPEAIDLRPASEIAAELAAVPLVPDGPMSIDGDTETAVSQWRAAATQVAALQADVPVEPIEGPEPALVRHVAVRLQALVEQPTADLEREAAHLTNRQIEAEAEVAEAAEEQRRRRRFSLIVFATAVAIAIIGVATSTVPLLAAAAVVGFAGVTHAARSADVRSTSDVDPSRVQRIEAELAGRIVSNDEVRVERERCIAQLAEWNLPITGAEAVAAADAQAAEMQRVAAWRQHFVSCQRHMNSTASAAAELLDSYTEATGSPAERLMAARQECETRRALDLASRQRTALEAELSRSEAYLAAVDQHRVDVLVAQGALIEAAAPFEAGNDIDEILAAIPMIAGRRDEALAEHDRRRSDWGRLQSQLDGRSLADHRLDLASLEARHRDAVAAGSHLIEDTVGGIRTVDGIEVDEANIDELVSTTGVRIRRGSEAVAAAQGRLDQLRESAPDVAISEATLTQAQAELLRVRKLAETLDHTNAFLARAQEQAHRTLAPRLEEEVTRWIPAVTGGRYDRARVDPESLQMKLRETTGIWREAAVVSHGTAEQVHLVLRVVLANLLTAPDERCPILLDDPTVHADADRKVEMLEFLREVSRHTQVVLFSQEDQVVAWAAERLDPDIDASVALLEGPDAAVEPVDDTGAIRLPGFVA
ncbi:MAG: exonuclease SbcC [Candidatus Poriferisodalaceae bacterium]|jgi:exonuclease SbcC